MRFNWASLSLAAVLATASLAPVSSALASQQAEDVLVDISLKDADMILATKILTERTGLQFVIEPSAEPFHLITLKLDRMPAKAVIGYICKSAGAYYRRDENGVYIISRNKPEETTIAPVAPALPEKMVVKRIKLIKADAEAVYNQVVYAIPYDFVDGFEKLNRFRAVTDMTQRFSPPDIRMIGQSAPTNNFFPTAGGNYSGPRTGLESGNDIRLPGSEQGRQFNPGGGIGTLPGNTGVGTPNQPGIGTGTTGVGNATLAGGQGLVPESIDYISYDPTDNSLIVRGTEEDIARLQGYIALFDVAPKQVQIKVEFITTSSGISRALGFDFLYQRGMINFGTQPGTFARSGDPVFLNFAEGNITTRMRALLNEGFGKTVNAPVLRTLNNQPASVQQSTSQTIFVSTTSVTNGAVVTNVNPQSLSVSTGLSVTPRINDDGTITMYLQPQIQDFGQLRRGPDGQEIPDQLSQAISVVARVKNGETIALGGLTRKSDQGSRGKIPLLGDLPIIGQFFRSTTRERNTSELIIFVTPTVIEDDETYAGP